MTDDDLDQRVRESLLSEKIDTSRVEQAVRQRIQAPQRHIPRLRHTPRRRQTLGWTVAAAILIAMLVAGALYRRQAAPALCIAAAQDHQNEIVDGQPRKWLRDLPAIQSLAQKQGVPVSAVAALATSGYRVERGRLCFLRGQIFLHLVYTRDGSEYSVYLRSQDKVARIDRSVREVSVGPEHSAYFETNRLTAVFVGPQAGVAAFARAGAAVLQDLRS
jgi:hypothetical protein